MTVRLSHRCTVWRATHSVDAYGQRMQTYAVAAEGVPCRLVERLVTAPEGMLAERPMVTRTTILLSPTVGVQVADRIDQVTDDSGAIQGVFVIRELVARRRGKHGVAHLTADVERIGQ